MSAHGTQGVVPVPINTEQADSIAHAAVSGDATTLVEAFAKDSEDDKFAALVAGLSAAYQQDPTATTATLAHALRLANENGHAEMAAHTLLGLLSAGGRHLA
jgi:thioredoxin-like negative regulator of GroEL